MRRALMATVLLLVGCVGRAPGAANPHDMAPDSQAPVGGTVRYDQPAATSAASTPLAPGPSVAALTQASPAAPAYAASWQSLTLRGPATASSGPAGLVSDGDRQTEWNPRTAVAPGAPQWLALPLAAPARGGLAVAWHGHALHYENYDYGRPRTYEVQASRDSTDGSDGSWDTLATVTDNLVRSRVDLVDAPGARWLRLRFLTTWGGTLENEPFLREVMVYERQADGAPDVWAVFGDSTTSVGLDPGQPEVFGPAVAARHPGHYPVLIPAGTGGDEAADAVARLAVGLPTLPRGAVVGLCYGTNDAKRAVPIADYKQRLQAAIDQIRQAGDQPILAVLPWSLNGMIADYAAACREVASANGLPPGPDFYQYFKDHPDQLQVDKVHPNDAGSAAMQRLWAESADFRYPTP